MCVCIVYKETNQRFVSTYSNHLCVWKTRKKIWQKFHMITIELRIKNWLVIWSGFHLSARVMRDGHCLALHWTMFGIVLCVFLSPHHITNTIAAVTYWLNFFSFGVPSVLFFCICLTYLSWSAFWIIQFLGSHCFALSILCQRTMPEKHCKNKVCNNQQMFSHKIAKNEVK